MRLATIHAGFTEGTRLLLDVYLQFWVQRVQSAILACRGVLRNLPTTQGRAQQAAQETVIFVSIRGPGES